MRCANCGHLSLGVICKICKDHLLSSPARTRVLDGDFKIYSFFDYSEVKNLLHSKHIFHGSFVYGALANLSFKIFASKFSSVFFSVNHHRAKFDAFKFFIAQPNPILQEVKAARGLLVYLFLYVKFKHKKYHKKQ